MFSRWRYRSGCCCFNMIMGSVWRSNDLAAPSSRNSMSSKTIYITIITQFQILRTLQTKRKRRNVLPWWQTAFRFYFNKCEQCRKVSPTCSYKSISFLSGSLSGWTAWRTVSQWPLFISPTKLSTLSTVFKVIPVSSCRKHNKLSVPYETTGIPILTFTYGKQAPPDAHRRKFSNIFFKLLFLQQLLLLLMYLQSCQGSW